MPAHHLTLISAFLAGMLSFISPCIFPVIPGFFSLIAGITITDIKEKKIEKTRVMQLTLFFVLGFSVVFIFLGASASFLGNIIFQNKDILRIIGGVLIILFGLNILGLFKFKFLQHKNRFNISPKSVNIFSSFLIGMGFAATWSPCLDPILGSILIVASNNSNVYYGMFLLSIYSLGIALPFMLFAIFINYILDILKKTTFILQFINTISGVFLIIIGILLLINQLHII